MTDILRLEGITKHFDGINAIDSLNLTLEAGRISSIIGPNGAGKSTLFNLICGYLLPDDGRIFYKDKDISAMSPWKRSLSGIGRLFQDIRVFKKLTVLENLMVTFNDESENPFKAIFGKRNGKEKEQRKTALKWLEFVGLVDMKDKHAENLSWGQQKLLCLARLLCGDFELMLIDEPVSGVNPDMIDIVLDKIKQLKGFGKTIIAVEHNLEAVQIISDYIYFMDAGKITASGEPDSILKDHKIMGSYMGI